MHKQVSNLKWLPAIAAAYCTVHQHAL